MICDPARYADIIPNMDVAARPTATVSRWWTPTWNASHNALGDTDGRRSTGSVSGTRSDHAASPTAAMIGIQNTIRHVEDIASAAEPSAGATTGTMMNVAITCAMVRAIRSPEYTSRIIASARDRGAAAPNPHRN